MLHLIINEPDQLNLPFLQWELSLSFLYWPPNEDGPENEDNPKYEEDFKNKQSLGK